jgi:hypothetical protein
VYENIAKFAVKPQLEENVKPKSRMLDVVSLIEMRDEAKVVLESVPLDGHLFNFLMQRRNEARPSSHGNYMPAQEAAEKLLNKFSHGGCALNLLFLSDGRPSDCHTDARPRVARPRGAVHAIQQEIVLRVQALTQKFGRRLNVGTIGFAGAQQDFSVLERMAAAAKVFSVASYQYANVNLGLTLTSLVNSFTSTKVEMTAADGLSMRTVRNVTRELPGTSDNIEHA